MRRWIAVVLLLFTAACGGKDNGPSERIPNYAGTWSGTYAVTGCNQTGDFATFNLCGSVGASAPYRFNLTQSQRNVTGSFTLGSVTFPSTGGTVASDGTLALTATQVDNGITIQVQWALSLPNALAGNITSTWSSQGIVGNMIIRGTISTATKTAAIVAPAARQPGTIYDTLRALQRE